VCDRVGIIRDGRLVAVEKVADLTGRAYRRVSLEFDTPVEGSEFERLPGVTGLVVAGNKVSFKAEGNLDAVVKAAARHTVCDIEVTQPTLEEVFLTYYSPNGGQ
jgi:ABC-2 type transport system ATP-binding protein